MQAVPHESETILLKVWCFKIWDHSCGAHRSLLSPLIHNPECSLGVEINAALIKNSHFNCLGGTRCRAAPSSGQHLTQTISSSEVIAGFSNQGKATIIPWYSPPSQHLPQLRIVSMCITIWLRSAFSTRLYLHEIISVLLLNTMFIMLTISPGK